MRLLRSLVAVWLFADASAGAAAQASPQAAVERLLRAEHASADWFAPSFLAQVSVPQIDAVTAQMRTQGGTFERVDVRNGTLYAIFAKGESKTQAVLDTEGRFVVLYFGPITAKVRSLEALRGLQTSNPGADLGYVVLQGDAQLAALAPDRPMAVGSAFKLAVLAALRAQIDANQRSWSDIVPLDAAAKSLSSAALERWPDGTPLTLATYAIDMISVSDNTAADTLIQIVGRANVQALTPRNDPFLTTREMFVLKAKDSTLRAAYLQGSAQSRRALLERVDRQPLPAIAEVPIDPSLLAIEWYLTPRELCALMARVQDLPLMTVNPGFPADAWQRVAYKGGSDGGVLNYTTFATAKSGALYCVTATWNNAKAPIDERAASSAYGALLQYLSSR